MQIGYISFCDSTAFNIKSENVKKNILNTIESLTGIKIIQRHFNNFNDNHFKKLNDIPHLVSLKSNGNPYLLFLTRINFTNISIFIDKKIQPGYFLPRMIVSYFQFDDSLYSNTLFDGEMVKIKGNKWNFILNDIYIHKNNNLSNQNIFNRLDIIYNILNSDVNVNHYDICNFKLNKYFKYSEMKYMVEEYKPKLNYTCRGIYFTPLYFKFKKVLYNFDSTLVNSVKRVKYQNNNEFMSSNSSIIKNHNQNQNRNIPISIKKDEPKNTNIHEFINTNKKDTSRVLSKDTSKDTIKEFYIERTDMPDVFYLYDINTNERFTTAYIPNISTSHYLKEIFKEVTIVTKLKVNCKLIKKNNKDKWCPIQTN